MKRLFTVFVVLLFTATMWAQNPPQKMSYQAVIRDDNGVLVKSHAIGMRISILKDGSPVYEETHATSTNDNGLVNIEIGSGTPTEGTFTAIDWSLAASYSIKTETDPTGGVAYTTIVGTSPLLSVPYALYAKTVASYTETDPNAVLLTGEQTVAGNKTFTGTTTVPTPVNATDAATKAYVDAILSQLSAKGAIVADADGNIYSTVRIGSQVWMAENLKTTKYNDGTDIPLVTDNTAWSNLTTPGFCWYSNNVANKDTHGGLYNWFTVNTGKLCPVGWRVPTQNGDWITLENYLIASGFNYDGTTTDNKIAKSLASISGWTSSSATGAIGNTDYTTKRNTTGFTALPGGDRFSDGTFGGVEDYGGWWSAYEEDPTTAGNFEMLYIGSGTNRGNGNKECGFSIRCVKD